MKKPYQIIDDAFRLGMAFVATQTCIRKSESMSRADAQRLCDEMNARDHAALVTRAALDRLQYLDELGGPEAPVYLHVMQSLAAECQRRAENCFASHIKGETYTDTRYGGRLVIDHMRDGRVAFFPQGGGFQHSVSIEEFARFFGLAPAPVFTLGRVTGEWLRAECIGAAEDVTFPAYLDGRKWNGWAMPYFLRETAADMLTASGNAWRFDENVDAFILDETGSGEQETYVGQDIEVNGARVHVYSVGAGAWTWDNVQEEA